MPFTSALTDVLVRVKASRIPKIFSDRIYQFLHSGLAL